MARIEELKRFLEGNESLWAYTPNDFAVKLPVENIICVSAGSNGNEVGMGKVSFEPCFYADMNHKAIIEAPNSQYMEYNFRKYVLEQTFNYMGADVMAEQLGYQYYNINETCKNVVDIYKSFKEKLMKTFPTLDSVLGQLSAKEQERINNRKFDDTDKRDIIRGNEINFSLVTPKKDGFHITLETICNGAEAVAESLYTEELGRNLVRLAIYYKDVELANETLNTLSPAEKIKKGWLDALKNISAKNVTVVYDSKMLLNNLAQIKQNLQNGSHPCSYSHKIAWNVIFDYLNNHSELAFKVDTKDIGISSDFIRVWNSNITNKAVLDLASHMGYNTNVPYEFEKALQDMKAFKDIRFRNKSIKA